jgi:malonate decarboxylase alpha subunit
MDRMIWNTKTANRNARLARVSQALGAQRTGKCVATEAVGKLLEAALEPGDRVCLEGNNQKQADFLAKSLAAVSPERVHDLHMV